MGDTDTPSGFDWGDSEMVKCRGRNCSLDPHTMPSGTILVRHCPNPSSDAGEWRWWHTIGVNLMILAGSSL